MSAESLLILTAKPCPFCQSSRLVLLCDTSSYWVGCKACRATGPTAQDGDPYGVYPDDRRYKPAVAAWNKRPRKRKV